MIIFPMFNFWRQILVSFTLHQPYAGWTTSKTMYPSHGIPELLLSTILRSSIGQRWSSIPALREPAGKAGGNGWSHGSRRDLHLWETCWNVPINIRNSCNGRRKFTLWPWDFPNDLKPSIGSTEVLDSSGHFVDQKEKVDLGPTPSVAPLSYCAAYSKRSKNVV